MLLVRRSHTPVVKNTNCEHNRKILPVANNHFLFQLSRGNKYAEMLWRQWCQFGQYFLSRGTTTVSCKSALSADSQSTLPLTWRQLFFFLKVKLYHCVIGGFPFHILNPKNMPLTWRQFFFFKGKTISSCYQRLPISYFESQEHSLCGSLHTEETKMEPL